MGRAGHEAETAFAGVRLGNSLVRLGHQDNHQHRLVAQMKSP